MRRPLVALLALNTCLALTVALFVPAAVYFYNAVEYPYYFHELALPLLLDTLLLLVLLTAPFLAARRHAAAVVPLLFALCLLTWIQATFLHWSYGIEDGRTVEASRWLGKFAIDAALWLGGIGVCVVLRKRITPAVAVALSVYLVVIQSLNLGYLYFKHETRFSHKENHLDYSRQFEFSKNENVLLIVLDSFQSDVFREIIDEDPDYRALFKDFTYYPDTTSGYAFTEPNVSLILTGQFYDNQRPFEDFKREAFSRDSLPANLKKRNWEVLLFPLNGKSVYLDAAFVDNIFGGYSPVGAAQRLPVLKDALVRALPSFVALPLRNSTEGKYRRAAKNLRAFRAKALSLPQRLGERNVFSYYHLPVPHWPLVINEKLEYESMVVNRSNYKRQAKASLQLAGGLIDRLKRDSLYESATVIVLGDHGALAQEQAFLPGGSEGNSNALGDPAGQGIPLLLVKQSRARNESLAVSRDRVSLQNIKGFIEAGRQLGSDGPRYFYSYRENDGPYFGPMEEYAVRGHAWDGGSWEATGTTYAKRVKSVRSVARVEYDRNYPFDDSIRAFLWSGWSFPEPGNLVWTEGKNATLRVRAADPHGAVELLARVHPFLVDGKLSRQRVDVFANAANVARWEMTGGEKTYRALLDRSQFAGNGLHLRFAISDPASPAMHGLGVDERLLGVAFSGIRFAVARPYAFGTPIDLPRPDAESFLAAGWSFPEAGFRWSEGNESRLRIPVADISGAIELRFSAWPLTHGTLQRQRVAVFVNGVFVQDLSIDGPGEYAVVAEGVSTRDNVLEIGLRYEDAASPAALGLNDDQRVLALAFETLVINLLGAPRDVMSSRPAK